MEQVLLVASGVFVTLVAAWWIGRRIGFRAQAPGDYSELGPAFDLRRHLSGRIQCEGVIFGPTGRVASRFTADFEASWRGNDGTMSEFFRYDSGATQERCWTLALQDDGRIRATAPDVVGEGRGEQRGPAVCLRYKIRLPEASGGHVLDVTDWMYLVDDSVIINRSQFRKFGIKVAELVATMRQIPEVRAELHAAE